MEVLDDFQAEIPQVNMDKLLAAVNIVTTDDFFKRLPRFVQLCNVLTGSALRPHVFDPADANECAWGMTEALLLHTPEEDDNEIFSAEIRYYLGMVLEDEGIRTPPDLLRLALFDTPSGEASFEGALDPEGFAMEFKVQESESEDIKSALKSRLMDLITQLQSVPLTNGDAKDLLQRMRGNL
jgi:hypothetical protein